MSPSNAEPHSPQDPALTEGDTDISYKSDAEPPPSRSPSVQPRTPSTTRRLPQSVALGETPHKKSSAAAGLNDIKPDKAKVHRTKAAEDMERYFLGPMPPDEFLHKLMPVPSWAPDDLATDFTIPFVPNCCETKQKTTRRFLTLIAKKAKAIMGSKCPLVPFESCDKHFDDHGRYPDVRPDFFGASDERVTASPTVLNGTGDPDDDSELCSDAESADTDSQSDLDWVPPGKKRTAGSNDRFKHLFSFKAIDFWGEDKPEEKYDAFNDDAKKDSFVRSTNDAKDTFGQLCAMYHVISQTQFRVRIFSLYFEEARCMCRLLCWTSSGVLVSSRFAFQGANSPVGEFFKRLSFMSRAQRGWDDTIKPADATDAALAAAAFQARREEPYAYKDGADPTEVMPQPTPTKNVDATEFIRIGVPVDGEPGRPQTFRYVIARRPENCSPRTPIGRRTLCLKVYDLITHRVIMIKDSWRTASLPEERERLKELNKAKVRHVPTFLFGGDIQEHAADLSEFFESAWNRNRHSNIFERREHQRIATWEIGDPLQRYACSLHAVKAARACIEGHDDAYNKCQLLHRDISLGNVLILRREDKNGEIYQSGLLIDWELSKHVYEQEARQFWRTGTWLYMSIKVSSTFPAKPLRPHNLSDDLESFYWVLLYLFMRYGGFSPGLQGCDAKAALQDLFYPPGNTPSSSLSKMRLVITLTRPPLGRKFSFSGGPALARWMEERMEDLGRLYHRSMALDVSLQDGEPLPPYEEAYSELVFGFHSLLLVKVDELLSETGWQEDDKALDVGGEADRKGSDSFESQPVLQLSQQVSPTESPTQSSGTKRKLQYEEAFVKKRLRSSRKRTAPS